MNEPLTPEELDAIQAAAEAASNVGLVASAQPPMVLAADLVLRLVSTAWRVQELQQRITELVDERDLLRSVWEASDVGKLSDQLSEMRVVLHRVGLDDPAPERLAERAAEEIERLRAGRQ